VELSAGSKTSSNGAATRQGDRIIQEAQPSVGMADRKVLFSSPTASAT
jgi:hypothetical protein